MTNKYLEKIASMKGAGSAVMDGLSAIGRVAKKGGQAYVHQLYKATGGTFMEHARGLGVHPDKLSQYTDLKKLYKLDRDTTLGANAGVKARRAHFRQFKDTVGQLKKDQTDARIIAGGTTAGAVYGAVKLKQKMDGDDYPVQTYQY